MSRLVALTGIWLCRCLSLQFILPRCRVSSSSTLPISKSSPQAATPSWPITASLPHCRVSFLPPPSGGNPILAYYGLDTMSKWTNLGIVAAFFAFWSLLAWFALAFVRHQQR